MFLAGAGVKEVLTPSSSFALDRLVQCLKTQSLVCAVGKPSMSLCHPTPLLGQGPKRVDSVPEGQIKGVVSFRSCLVSRHEMGSKSFLCNLHGKLWELTKADALARYASYQSPAHLFKKKVTVANVFQRSSNGPERRLC